MTETEAFTTIDAYMSEFPAEIQARLSEMRRIIHEEAPQATEKISYRMPTFYYFGNLVHFAAFKKHIGFFPGADGIEMFKDKLTAYSWSKGGVQFPYEKPLPEALIREIVAFRLRQNEMKAPKNRRR
ncbi:DUF1801 domain-containing protein [Oscillospiraceae bacterium CM]|nr:DUF1801 domain-containing protein [Oscillospiraceae bacterium CM]